MGILDDAIKDHLDLKRRRGTDEPEIKRLEDEAFGPPGRPDASGAADAAVASALATPGTDTAVEDRPGGGDSPQLDPDSPEMQPEAPDAEPKVEAAEAPEAPVSETPPVPDGPAPEDPPAPAPELTPDDGPSDGSPEASGGIAFHDFAAEEGLIAASEPALENPFVDESAAGSATSEPPAAGPTEESPVPHSEDTQVHDMARELGLGGDEAAAPEKAGAGPEPDAASALDDLELGELDLELEDDEFELPAPEDEPASPNGSAEPPEPEGSVGVAEESESDELEIVESDGEEPAGDGEDVLEETPEFLRDAPESDRLWFEQGKPKDFDFDDEDE